MNELPDRTTSCLVSVSGKTKLRLALQWYFDLSKQKVLLLPKPKQNRAGQAITVTVTDGNIREAYGRKPRDDETSNTAPSEL